MSHVLDDQQSRAWYLIGERTPMRQREQRVFVSVDHQGRRGDLTEPVTPRAGALGQHVIGHARRHVGASRDGRLGYRAHLVGVEGHRCRAIGPGLLDDVVDDGFGSPPIRARATACSKNARSSSDTPGRSLSPGPAVVEIKVSVSSRSG